MTLLHLIMTGAAAVAGGLVNALAGGGTLITFPMLTAVGVPSVAANITNTVALCPGYIGGTLAQRADLAGQRKRLWLLLPTSVVGGIVGALFLTITGEAVFRKIIPYLILTAVILLAFQDRLRNWVTGRRDEEGHRQVSEVWSAVLMFPAAVYGGYFGAGLGVMTLAVLGLVLEDSLVRLNAMKQALSFCINIAAAVYFLFSGQVVWSAAVVMAIGALAGGALGGRLAGRIKPHILRMIVISIGLVVAAVYLFR